ncbi:MAG: hypothetical protein QOH90_237 [Actinomycetota bacterium]|jgi:hypothetical protein|nr:hypothetical protein [Actinomycetota bacterium]
MKASRTLLLGALVLTLGMVTQAWAGDFTPKITFTLSDTRVNANPQMKVHLEQDDKEEELAHVTLSIPSGFKIPGDAKIADGDDLGSGQIVIDVGPGCNPSSPTDAARAPATLPATLTEQDRTDAQVDAGVRAVWHLSIQGVVNVDLAVTGNKTLGYKLDGDIPANDNTCPPFAFDLNVNSQSGAGVPIIRNPGVAGPKTFKAKFQSQDSSAISVTKQVIKIKP